MIRRIFIPILLIGLILAPPARAADTKQQLHDIENRISKQSAEAAALDEKAATTRESIGGLQQKLIAATAALVDKEEEQEGLEERQAQLAADIAAKTAALAGERRKLGMLTAAMVELGRQPAESFFLRTGLTSTYVDRAIVLRAIVPRVKEQAEAIARDLITLGELKAQMAEQERLTAAAKQNLAEQQKGLDQMIRARQGMIQRTEAQKEDAERQLVSLAEQANDLRQLLDKVAPKHGTRQTHFSLLAPAPLLKSPVAGRIIRHYGERDADGVTSDGIIFAGLPGAPVVAPRAGRVVFAGPFKGYGLIVILQHEGGSHSFLAGFGRIDADMAQNVEAGEPLGVLPAKAGTKPELYFEWRRDNNEPADPGIRG